MYITKVVLENIRCFEKLEIDFAKPGSSVLFLGNNGDGKSTVLRSIAIGLCDESSAAALFRELPGEFVRRKPGEKECKFGAVGTIKITLAGDAGKTYQIITNIKSGKTFERVFQLEDKSLYCSEGQNKKPKLKTQDTFPWGEIFVSGYGAGTRIQGTADFQHYLAVDAIYPLFKYDEPLQNPELVIRRLVEAARGKRKVSKTKKDNAEKVLDSIKRLLAGFLDLKKSDKIHLTETGITVKGRWGIAELGELGDGYRSTVTWVLDLLAWWFLKATRKDSIKIEDVRGIVLFDEIEQHLHPKWQRYVLSYFKEAFPQVQFIATTHSPLCAAGTADFKDDTFQLINIIHSMGASKANFIDPPRGLRADQILTSSAFNLTDTRNPSIGKHVDRYRELVLRSKLNNKEQIELKKLRKFINENVPEAGQFEEERKMRYELRDLIKKVKKLKTAKKGYQ